MPGEEKKGKSAEPNYSSNGIFRSVPGLATGQLVSGEVVTYRLYSRTKLIELVRSGQNLRIKAG
jgi:hypothetical protein